MNTPDWLDCPIAVQDLDLAGIRIHLNHALQLNAVDALQRLAQQAAREHLARLPA